MLFIFLVLAVLSALIIYPVCFAGELNLGMEIIYCELSITNLIIINSIKL